LEQGESSFRSREVAIRDSSGVEKRDLRQGFCGEKMDLDFMKGQRWELKNNPAAAAAERCSLMVVRSWL
jgi:hypothetical protein